MAIVKQAVNRADIVVCPETTLLPWLASYCARHAKPMIWVLHTNFLRLSEFHFSGPEVAITTPATHAVFAFSTRLIPCVLTTSRDYLEYLQSHNYSVESYIDQGFKTDVFKANDPPEAIAATRRELSSGQVDRPMLLFAGRFSDEKRIHLLLKARPENAILVLVGDGALRETLMKEHDPQRGVVVISRMVTQAELRLFYKAADLVVSASDFETYGMTIHEALLCGTPVVVEKAKGFTQQIRHGINGLLINYDDTQAAHDTLLEALTMKFDAQPIPDPRAISLQDKIIESARIGRERINPIFYGILYLVELCLVMMLWVAAAIWCIDPIKVEDNGPVVDSLSKDGHAAGAVDKDPTLAKVNKAAKATKSQ
ncbi:uncharacterized protein MONBRDRAFT_29346 [Monosiga brevicollis MX1]|uniref:Glycosyl transferase family 1 domain-containing protein n=1 Tax=Monosiga brevicollis TaxID=81824 RepID=A9VAU3_MONBE|nr:uncharacterized protein MONBRDRAFT_29346 [Monosiga brevicollis MX1]EDQ85380.1 predicted protein [Monosiga brevicollis MX1]|eukprot:XP_001749791.1 hypothetical protein [Monosiga brevicollis MX1]